MLLACSTAFSCDLPRVIAAFFVTVKRGEIVRIIQYVIELYIIKLNDRKECFRMS